MIYNFSTIKFIVCLDFGLHIQFLNDERERDKMRERKKEKDLQRKRQKGQSDKSLEIEIYI